LVWFVAQVIAPYVDGRLLAALFGSLCLIFAVRFAFPERFRPLVDQPPGGHFRDIAGLGIGAVSGFAGVGGGILTNIVMTLSGLPMHKSIVVRPPPGRCQHSGDDCAALASKALQPTQIGSIDYAIWACIAPAQAIAAWFGRRACNANKWPNVSVEYLQLHWRSAGSPSCTLPCDRRPWP